MADIKDIVFYLLKVYPHKRELSNARVTKMLYLADWRACLTMDRQLSPVHWYFNNYGPYVADVRTEVLAHPDLFHVEDTSNWFGSSKTIFAIRDREYEPQLQDADMAVLDHVISKTEGLTWDGFIRLVYSTYPILQSERYSTLELTTLAREYRELSQEHGD